MIKISNPLKFDLQGPEGNIFYILGKAAQALKDAGMPEKAKSLIDEVTNSKNYDEALSIIEGYVSVEYEGRK